MIEAGKDLPLILETIEDEIRVLTRADQLDGNLYLVLVVCAESPVDLTHAANADLPHDLIGADTLTEEHVRRDLGFKREIDLCQGCVEEIGAGPFVKSNEGLEFRLQIGVDRSHFRK